MKSITRARRVQAKLVDGTGYLIVTDRRTDMWIDDLLSHHRALR